MVIEGNIYHISSDRMGIMVKRVEQGGGEKERRTKVIASIYKTYLEMALQMI